MCPSKLKTSGNKRKIWKAKNLDKTMDRDHNLYSYVVRVDNGFAPNPERRLCTLACCKPGIRKKAKVGDWLIGTGSKKHKARFKLIYAMKITEKMPFEDYFTKKCKYKNRKDQIYDFDKKNNRFKIIENKELYGHDNMNALINDRKGQYVLISDKYYYFGENALGIRGYRRIVKKGPNCKKFNINDVIVKKILGLIKSDKTGKRGEPLDLLKEQC